MNYVKIHANVPAPLELEPDYQRLALRDGVETGSFGYLIPFDDRDVEAVAEAGDRMNRIVRLLRDAFQIVVRVSVWKRGAFQDYSEISGPLPCAEGVAA